MSTLKIDAATLAADAAWIAKGKSRRTYVPVLATAHVSITDDGIRLRMTDYDLFREVIVPAENAAASDVAVLVDPEKLAKFLKGAKGDALVSVDADGIRVDVAGRTITVGKADGDIADYPQWPNFESRDMDTAELDPATIKRALSSVGKDDTLPMLTGVRFEDGQMVTTDRFRMSRIEYGSTGFTALVPSGPLKLFTVGKGVVRVQYGTTTINPRSDEMSVRISRDGRSVVSRVLDAEFPKWRHLIDSAESNATIVAEIRKADLLAALAGDTVDLTFNPGGTMTVDAREVCGDGGIMVSQTIAAEVVSDDGLPFTIRANAQYLADVLKGIAADVVTFSASTSARPMLWSGGADLHLLMPLRIAA